MSTKPLIQRIIDFNIISLAANQKVRDRSETIPKTEIDVDVDAPFFVELNKDPKLGPGYWVKAWLFVSQNEAENAEDPSI